MIMDDKGEFVHIHSHGNLDFELNTLAEIDRPSFLESPSLAYPFAYHIYDMPTQGRYEKGYPEGAVIHYTAGRSKRGDIDAINTIKYGARLKHCYFCISSKGTIYQTAPLDHWGYHAGKSSHDRLGHKLSMKLVGIELCCAGKLKKTADGKYVSWFDEEYSTEEIRIRDGVPYHEYTEEQENSLEKLLLWLARNNPAVFSLDNVVGHDEINTSKSDPGGSLSYTMAEYRFHLKEKYKEYTCC